MPITLAPALEARIQKTLALGTYRESDELLSHALDLLEAEEGWFQRNRDAINQRLDESFAQAERGESYSPEEAKKSLGSHHNPHLRDTESH